MYLLLPDCNCTHTFGYSCCLYSQPRSTVHQPPLILCLFPLLWAISGSLTGFHRWNRCPTRPQLKRCCWPCLLPLSQGSQGWPAPTRCEGSYEPGCSSNWETQKRQFFKELLGSEDGTIYLSGKKSSQCASTHILADLWGNTMVWKSLRRLVTGWWL